jgi:hypothetical protein
VHVTLRRNGDQSGQHANMVPEPDLKVYCHKIHVAILDDYYYLGLFGFLYLNGYDGYDASQKIAIQEEF